MEHEQSIGNLISQREQIDSMIESMRKEARAGVISKIIKSMLEYGIQVKDLATNRAKPVEKSEPKYFNHETNETWTGRGRQPKWLKDAVESGKSINDFLIVTSA